MHVPGFARIFILLLPVLLTVAHAQTQAVEELPQRWMTAFNSGNLAAVGEIYSADARLYPPSGAVANGRAAIVEAFAGLVAAGATHVEITLVDARSFGGDAYLIGRYVFFDAGGDVLLEGHGVVMARESGGVWTIERHLSNQASPPL